MRRRTIIVEPRAEHPRRTVALLVQLHGADHVALTCRACRLRLIQPVRAAIGRVCPRCRAWWRWER